MKIKLEKKKTSETMKKIIFFFTVIFLVINLKAQDGSKHIPWKLDGALERIEKIRKGEVVLEFYHENKRLKNKKGDFKIELISHNFNFGVSMTQSRDLFQTAKFEIYRDRVKELFNFITVGFYWVLFDEKITISENCFPIISLIL